MNDVHLVLAKNGLDALLLLNDMFVNRHLPDLILMDINMPILDGRETLVKLRTTEKFKDLSIVLYSTSDSLMDKAFAKKWKAAYLSKPIKAEDIDNIADTIMQYFPHME